MWLYLIPGLLCTVSSSSYLRPWGNTAPTLKCHKLDWLILQNTLYIFPGTIRTKFISYEHVSHRGHLPWMSWCVGVSYQLQRNVRIYFCTKLRILSHITYIWSTLKGSDTLKRPVWTGAVHAEREMSAEGRSLHFKTNLKTTRSKRTVWTGEKITASRNCHEDLFNISSIGPF